MRAVLVLAVLCLWSATALQFMVPGGDTKCIGELAQVGEVIIGRWAVVPEEAGMLSVRVYSPSNADLYFKDRDKSGKIAVTASVVGEHRLCVSNPNPDPKIVEVVMEAGVTAKDYEAVAKKENLKPIEKELRRVEDVVQMVFDDLQYLKSREEELWATNEATNSRVLLFSCGSILFLVGLGIGQLYYLKQLFSSKRLI